MHRKRRIYISGYICYDIVKDLEFAGKLKVVKAFKGLKETFFKRMHSEQHLLKQ